MTFKLIAVETHPIQYKAPLFRMIASDPRFDLTVFYAMIPDQDQQGVGFGVSFAWDIPLLEGYRYEVLANRANEPSVTRFSGCDTPDIIDRLKHERPDAVLVNGWVVKTCWQTVRACRRLGIPCLVRGEANLLRPRAAWKHLLHHLLLTRYHAYLFIGTANREFYRFHRCPENRLFFAPYSVDNDYFLREARAREGTRHALRMAFGIAPESFVLLFIGKLEPKKRPLDLLQAVAQLPGEQRKRVHILVVGMGVMRDEMEQFARDHELHVTLAGFLNQTQLPDAYAAADVLVLPSDSGETWGLVVNEAMASGRPALVSQSVGCCRDLIVENQTGYSFPCGDIAKLAGHISRYVAEPERAASHGGAARHHIETFCFARIIDGIYAALLHVRNDRSST